MKNRLVNVLLFVFLVILVILIFLSIRDYNNRPGNNIKTNKNVNTNNDNKNNINDDSSDDINNSEKKEESGPAETEEEENINEKEENVTVNLELIGEEEVKISQGEKYVDAGIKATDSEGNDITSKITIDNKVNTNKKGEYMVIYSYGKSIVIRKVIVE